MLYNLRLPLVAASRVDGCVLPFRTAPGRQALPALAHGTTHLDTGFITCSFCLYTQQGLLHLLVGHQVSTPDRQPGLHAERLPAFLALATPATERNLVYSRRNSQLYNKF